MPFGFEASQLATYFGGNSPTVLVSPMPFGFEASQLLIYMSTLIEYGTVTNAFRLRGLSAQNRQRRGDLAPPHVSPMPFGFEASQLHAVRGVGEVITAVSPMPFGFEASQLSSFFTQ